MLHQTFSIACSPSRKILIYNIIEDSSLKKPISNNTGKKVKPITKTEFERLNKVLDNEERNHKYRNLLKLHLIAGSRIGETLARSENDFDEINNTLNIWNTLTQDENYHVIWGTHTKTYNKLTGIDEGQRFLPLDSPIFSRIADIIKEEKAKKIKSINNIHNVLFWDYQKDRFITPSEVNSWLDRLEAKYHILDEDDDQNLTTHRMRHYAITYWAELVIDDVIRDADEAVRIMVFRNGEKKIYAKRNSNGEPEPDTIPFYSDQYVYIEPRENFYPNDVDRYTIVVWVEGDDPDCINDIIGGEMKMHLEINEEHVQK
mgnify:CR=1 FL=1